jgi:hypothetical protein
MLLPSYCLLRGKRKISICYNAIKKTDVTELAVDLCGTVPAMKHARAHTCSRTCSHVSYCIRCFHLLSLSPSVLASSSFAILIEITRSSTNPPPRPRARSIGLFQAVHSLSFTARMCSRYLRLLLLQYNLLPSISISMIPRISLTSCPMHLPFHPFASYCIHS